MPRGTRRDCGQMSSSVGTKSFWCLGERAATASRTEPFAGRPESEVLLTTPQPLALLPRSDSLAPCEQSVGEYFPAVVVCQSDTSISRTAGIPCDASRSESPAERSPTLPSNRRTVTKEPGRIGRCRQAAADGFGALGKRPTASVGTKSPRSPRFENVRLLRGNEIHPRSSPQRGGRRNGASVKPSGLDEPWFRMAQTQVNVEIGSHVAPGFAAISGEENKRNYIQHFHHLVGRTEVLRTPVADIVWVTEIKRLP